MWFLRDASGEKVSEFFPSQAKLAVHMQMTPQTLQRAIKKGKNVFHFCGQEVRAVQQTIPQFAVFDFPPSENRGNPIATFELVSEVAKWMKVPAQTVYVAVKRGDETKVKNKEGKVFLLKKLESESGMTPVLPQPQPPVSPEAVVPPAPAPISRGLPPTPPEVVEIAKRGQAVPFNPKEQLGITTFLSAAKLAKFIRYGLGKLFLQGTKKSQMFICDDKRIFLPDLVKEIIVFHIRDQMWKDKDGSEAFIEKVVEYNFRCKKPKEWIQGGFLARVRKLDDETIDQICKEFMKLF